MIRCGCRSGCQAVTAELLHTRLARPHASPGAQPEAAAQQPTPPPRQSWTREPVPWEKCARPNVSNRFSHIPNGSFIRIGSIMEPDLSSESDLSSELDLSWNRISHIRNGSFIRIGSIMEPDLSYETDLSYEPDTNRIRIGSFALFNSMKDPVLSGSIRFGDRSATCLIRWATRMSRVPIVLFFTLGCRRDMRRTAFRRVERKPHCGLHVRAARYASTGATGVTRPA